ncbi:MAG: hypothetical protein AAF483_12710 [Planctomycetota bacterium]
MELSNDVKLPVSQEDEDELDRIVPLIRKRFDDRDPPKEANERVFFRLTPASSVS